MPVAVYLLGLGIFAITTSEFSIAGMLPSIAAAFGVSLPAAGYLISGYAAGMVVGGPVLAVGLLRLRQRTALLALIGGFLAAQILAAAAQDYPTMMVARVLTGVTGAAFFGVAIAVAADLVGPGARGRAASVVLGGLMLGTVLGLPAATVVDQVAGWRVAFWLVAVLVAVTGLILAAVLPGAEPAPSAGIRSELTVLRRPGLWAAFSTSGLVIGAVFAAFSYLAPIMTDATGFAPSAVPVLLAVYGVATVIGNAVVGRLADRYPMQIVAIGLAVLTVVLTAFALLVGEPVAVVVAVVLLGLVGVSLNPAMVIRVMRAGNDRLLVNAVHGSVISAGVLVGSWAGGLGIAAGYGLVAPLWIGAALAVGGLLSLVPYLAGRPGRGGAEPSPAVTPTPGPGAPVAAIGQRGSRRARYRHHHCSRL